MLGNRTKLLFPVLMRQVVTTSRLRSLLVVHVSYLSWTSNRFMVEHGLTVAMAAISYFLANILRRK